MKEELTKKEVDRIQAAQRLELENIIDGVKIPVTYRRKTAQDVPTTEEILVRKIPICDLDPLGRAFGTYSKEVAVYAERDEVWAKSLSDESFEAVLEEGRRLNFHKLEKWFGWQDATVKAINSSGLDSNAVVQEVQRKMAEKSPSASA